MVMARNRAVATPRNAVARRFMTTSRSRRSSWALTAGGEVNVVVTERSYPDATVGTVASAVTLAGRRCALAGRVVRYRDRSRLAGRHVEAHGAVTHDGHVGEGVGHHDDRALALEPLADRG